MERVKGRNKTMWNLIVFLVILIALVIIFFNLPYSKTKTEFKNAVEQKISAANIENDIFTENDIQGLPSSVQKYINNCGYIGQPKMKYMKVEFKNVDFKTTPDKTIKIDYTQYNFVSKPDRFALIDSSLFGVPFEGFDSYKDGIGSMKGRLAKLITLFDQRGAEMDKACLVTYLAECLLLPSAALQDYIVWEEIDATHAKATINYYGLSASGIFTFDEDGLWLSFKTSDRVAMAMDGTKRQADWTAIIDDYHKVNGILLPKVVLSIWNYPEGDFVYFNENKSELTIEYY